MSGHASEDVGLKGGGRRRGRRREEADEGTGEGKGQCLSRSIGLLGRMGPYVLDIKPTEERTLGQQSSATNSGAGTLL